MVNKTTTEMLNQITAGYLVNGCKGCPFYGIEDFEIEQYCDGTPIYCKWLKLWKYFEHQEAIYGSTANSLKGDNEP